MLNFKRVEGSDKLNEQFGMDEQLFIDVAAKWKKTFDAIDEMIESRIKKSLDDGEEGLEFDASSAFEIFFEQFNTQELQEIALIQLLMNDSNRRAKRAVKNALRGDLSNMLRDLAGAMGRELGEKNDEPKNDEGFDEDLL